MQPASTILIHRLAITSAIGCSLAFGSCRLNSNSERSAARAAEQPVAVGEIALVDEANRFVLIDLASSLYVPEPGVLLRAKNASRETARLKTAPERKRPFVAADIVDGEPKVGDQVVR
jgi:hypothetical protein